jgi:potassium-transporting ATPase KdpC subunit
MRRDLVTSALAIVVFTVLFGLAYPLATTGVSQVVFASKADGSRVERDGKLVGSRLIGQDFKGDARYFQSRPSVTGYNPAGTFFNNLGPNSKELSDSMAKLRAAYARRERIDPVDVPVDAVTTSGSGVDPHISQANARIQARRVARKRGLTIARLDELIDEHTDGRALGFLGEPGVNVLELNLALDEEAS